MQIISNCLECKHFIHDKKFTCKAFPKGIPNNILFNEVEHNKRIKGQSEEYIFEPEEESKEEL